MSSEPAAHDLLPALRNTHRGVLLLLVICGFAIGVAGEAGPSTPPHPWATTAAVGLALVAIVLRRFASSPVASQETTTRLAVGALVASGGLGLLGTAIAFQAGSREAGLLFTLAGLIFALRVPRPGPGPERR